MGIRDATYTNDVCQVVLSRPQGAHTGGTIRVSGTPTSFAESSFGSPTLDLDFAKTQSVDSRITFSRASVASFYNSSGYIEFTNTNVPRINFDPDTKECLGLLMEGEATNSFTHSEWQGAATNGFTNLDSDNTFNYFTGGLLVSPYGVTGTPYRELVPSTLNSSIRYALASQTYVAGQINIFSVFMRLTTTTPVYPCLIMDTNNAPSGGCFARFDLVNGTVVQAQSVNVGTYITSGIEKLPNNWCRCWIVGSPSTAGSGRIAISIRDNTTTSNGYDPAYVPASTAHGVYVTGIQYEQNVLDRRRPSAYIRTNGASFTKLKDEAYITGTNFSSWYNQSEGTILVDYYKRFSGNYAGYPSVYAITDGTNNNSIPLYNAQGSTQLTNLSVVTNGVNQNPYMFGFTQVGLNRVVQSYRQDRLDLVVNGARVSNTLNIFSVPTVNQISIGHSRDGGNQLNDCISRIIYYPQSIDPNVSVGMTIPRKF